MGRKGSSGMGNGGSVTPTSIPSLTHENLQAFVDQFGTGMSVTDMVSKIYTALPTLGTTKTPHGLSPDKGAAVLNDKYLQTKDGTTYQFIRQKSQGTWKVKQI